MSDKDKKTTEGGDEPENEIEAEDTEENREFNKEDYECRFHRNEWPEINELVVVEITNVNDDGAYVKLLEYNNIEALILATNTTRKRVKNVKKLLRLGT